ncbi:hypothetical protein TrVE_jg4863 [Triparma verrucosa]|uniref:Glycoside hydrolase family 5 domain-containing protein n=1 Tax=Triparma verrucosa TaxID=1606542 RepID=A0A9W6Z3F0_9STRA|nr:hypothetical protein TrVE_jg4863 [Triparma verrucosa]
MKLSYAALFWGASLCPVTASLQHISTADNHFTDEQGRIRIFHGFNDVQNAKGKQPSKDGENFTPKLSRDEAVITEWAEDVGVNCLRTPMMWAGANPDAPDTYDDTYISTMEGIVDSLADHGIYSFLDMHQDVISSLTGSYDGIPLYLAEQTEVWKEYPWPLKLPLHGWGEGYLALQTGAIFQDIYDNTHGALTQWANFWKRVATTFKGNANVIGYELINEPWPGNIMRHPSLMLPGNAGRKSLMPSYDVVSDAIREVDEDHLIFYEPVTWGMIFNGKVSGSGFDRVPGGEKWKDKSVLSYHYYCWFQRGGDDPLTPIERTECDRAFAPQVFKEIEKDKAKLGGAAMMTEFGGNSPNASEPDSGGVEEMDFLLDTADEYFSSWAFWDVAAFYDPTTHESKRENLAVFARIYASAIAGVPKKMKTVRKENTFELEYDIDDQISGMTEIIVPRLAMEKGVYDVNVEGGAVVECDNNLGDQVVCIENDKAASSVSVKISPK